MRLDVRGVAALITGVPTLLSFTFTNWSLDCAGASQPAWLTQCVSLLVFFAHGPWQTNKCLKGLISCHTCCWEIFMDDKRLLFLCSSFPAALRARTVVLGDSVNWSLCRLCNTVSFVPDGVSVELSTWKWPKKRKLLAFAAFTSSSLSAGLHLGDFTAWPSSGR